MAEVQGDYKVSKDPTEAKALMDWSQEHSRKTHSNKQERRNKNKHSHTKTSLWYPDENYRDNYDSIFRDDKDAENT